MKPAESSGVFPIVTYSGGYSGGAPPLPMPNREVKPARADGTARKGGRVGRRRAYRGRRPGDQLGLRHRAASLRLWRPRCAYLMYLGRASGGARLHIEPDAPRRRSAMWPSAALPLGVSGITGETLCEEMPRTARERARLHACCLRGVGPVLSLWGKCSCQMLHLMSQSFCHVRLPLRFICSL